MSALGKKADRKHTAIGENNDMDFKSRLQFETENEYILVLTTATVQLYPTSYAVRSAITATAR